MYVPACLQPLQVELPLVFAVSLPRGFQVDQRSVQLFGRPLVYKADMIQHLRQNARRIGEAQVVRFVAQRAERDQPYQLLNSNSVSGEELPTLVTL